MTEDPARKRYFAIQAIRLGGVAMALLGIAVVQGKLDWPRVAGYALLIVGLFDVFVMPTILARRWKTPK